MTEKPLQQKVSIKGTKEGLIFYLDDDCTFDSLLDAVQTTLYTTDNPMYDDEKASVTLKLGFRYLKPEQKQVLRSTIEKDGRFIIDKYDSEVIGKQEAEHWLEESAVKKLVQIVRSGQVIEVKGDLLLIGDVNPGGHVKATGSIYVVGHLYGIAHAGVQGNERAVVAASYMHPTQLRIAKYISRAPDYDAAGVYMECGYLDKQNNKIKIDRLQVLPYLHKGKRDTERGVMNG